MTKRTEAPETPALLHVWPSPALADRGEYLAGVGIDGADVPAELAAEWQAAGLVTTSPPAEGEE